MHIVGQLAAENFMGAQGQGEIFGCHETRGLGHQMNRSFLKHGGDKMGTKISVLPVDFDIQQNADQAQ
ncbi:hypothetical protein D3C81_1896560 [compost metagenome]